MENKPKWDAQDYCMVILASAIPLGILVIPFNRWITGTALSDNAANVISNLITAVGVGILTLMKTKR